MAGRVELLIALTMLFGLCASRLERRQRIWLRRKQGESQAEAHLIMLGTFRFYSWLSALNTVRTAAGWLLIWLLWNHHAGATQMVFWHLLATAIIYTGLLPLAHALYWRLGYGPTRYLLVLSHLTGILLFWECYYRMRRELFTYLRTQSA